MEDKIKARRYWKKWSDCDIFNYVSNYHNGKTIKEFEKAKENIGYTQAYRRGLINLLVNQGVLIRERIKGGSWKNRSDCDLFNYINNYHFGETPNEFKNSKDKRCYARAYDRKLLDFLVTKGVLIRKRGRWQDLDYTLEQAEQFMKENKLEEFPCSEKIEQMGCRKICYAISKYHGGFPKFKEVLYQKMGIQTEKDKLTKIFEEYVKQNGG